MKKKYALLVLIILVFILSITFIVFISSKEGRFVYSGSGFLYRFEVYEDDLCNIDSGAFETEHNFYGFETNCSNIQYIIRITTDKKKYKKAKYEFKNFKDSIIHNIYFTGKFSEESRRDLLDQTLEHYSLKLNERVVEENFFEVYVKDQQKLEKHQSKSEEVNSSSAKVEQGKIIIKNFGLRILDGYFPENITFDVNTSKKYNLEFNNSSLKENKENLERYGLSYRRVKLPVLYYIIESK